MRDDSAPLLEVFPHFFPTVYCTRTVFEKMKRRQSSLVHTREKERWSGQQSFQASHAFFARISCSLPPISFSIPNFSRGTTFLVPVPLPLCRCFPERVRASTVTLSTALHFIITMLLSCSASTQQFIATRSR